MACNDKERRYGIEKEAFYFRVPKWPHAVTGWCYQRFGAGRQVAIHLPPGLPFLATLRTNLKVKAEIKGWVKEFEIREGTPPSNEDKVTTVLTLSCNGD